MDDATKDLKILKDILVQHGKLKDFIKNTKSFKIGTLNQNVVSSGIIYWAFPWGRQEGWREVNEYYKSKVQHNTITNYATIIKYLENRESPIAFARRKQNELT